MEDPTEDPIMVNAIIRESVTSHLHHLTGLEIAKKAARNTRMNEAVIAVLRQVPGELENYRNRSDSSDKQVAGVGALIESRLIGWLKAIISNELLCFSQRGYNQQLPHQGA